MDKVKLSPLEKSRLKWLIDQAKQLKGSQRAEDFYWWDYQIDECKEIFIKIGVERSYL